MRDFVMFILIAALCSAFTGCVCRLEPFVVGGGYANIKNYPHAVYLSVECQMRWICGASILNQRIIITAAHCLFGCNTNYRTHFIEAYAGHENLEKVRSTRSVSSITVHADYDEESVSNDIALALLKTAFPLGKNIKRVIIARRFSHDMQKGVVAGWGITNDFTEEDTVLLKSVKQTIRPSHICARIGYLDGGMFCAGSTKIIADHPSRGDSGSALITPSFEEIGLVSFRVNKLPALMVYTNITFFYDWIERTSRRLFCKAKGNKNYN